ncbi:hypothetical protein GALMADRAFT_246874 [Galerina marginata CBS 339.88]|uniref:F-box domain-containing protein n=1 Tax=Galerina marginata (strain CBS 339.88) TaxID=685588 RepID=A0A067TC03_GALM3|nr:hypothetical protein GALMADRAFT_246874 [Galerina marginata CBS 339.88]
MHSALDSTTQPETPNSSDGYTTGNNESSHLQLPPELFEVIIDHLESRSLKVCALVCRVFAHNCQKRLFKRITLGRPFQSFKRDIVSKVWPAQRLYEVLSKSPNLCKLVEELEISDSGIKSFYREELSWIRKDSNLSQILPMLNNLKELSIQGHNMGSRLNFRAWEPELKLAIWRKCQSLSKVSLRFMRNVPLSLLKFAPSLKALSLFKILFIPDDTILSSAAEPTTPVIQAELRSLSVFTTSNDEWTSLYPWLLVSIDFSHFVSMDLYVDFIDEETLTGPSTAFGAVTQLVHRSSNTVKRLSIFFPEEVASPSYYDQKYFNLGSMPCLQYLALNGCIWSEFDSRPLNNVHWLLTILTKIPQSSSLQRIDLNFTVEDCEVEKSNFGLATAGWKDFMGEINKLERSTSVFVSISILGASASYVKSVLDECLAPLLEKGIAEVSVDTDIN